MRDKLATLKHKNNKRRGSSFNEIKKYLRKKSKYPLGFDAGAHSVFSWVTPEDWKEMDEKQRDVFKVKRDEG